MLDSELAKLLRTRDECLRRQITHPEWNETESAKFHQATRSIVNELRRWDNPLTVLPEEGRPVALHLTADRMSFVELDARSGKPLYCDPKEWKPSVLYRYPKEAG
jgi:hypothetical protein